MAVKVAKSQAVAMFQALGFKTAGKWNKPRLNRKLTEVVETSEEDKFEIEDNEELNALLQSIVSSEDGFELVDDSDEPETKPKGEPKDESETVVVEKEPKAKKEPKDEKEKPAKKVNRFESTLAAVRDLKESTSLEGLATVADDLYVQAGGKSNVVESKSRLEMAVQAGVFFGVVGRDGKTVTPVSK